MKPLRFIAAWGLYWLGYRLHGLTSCQCLLIGWSQRAQGVYGFKGWPWKRDDLWIKANLPTQWPPEEP